MSRKIYVASSWRNLYQPAVVATLRDHGHEVYDFRNPKPGDKGFGWSSIDPNWKNWNPDQFKKALQHPTAQAGHKSDHTAMRWADTGVLVLPSGNSAHLETGIMSGWGKPTCVYVPELREPELMYLSLSELEEVVGCAGMLCTHMDEVLDFLKTCGNKEPGGVSQEEFRESMKRVREGEV